MHLSGRRQGIPIIRVLVVDDSQRWQVYILKRFETESDLKIVSVASEGWEAVQKAADLKPDVILMDLNLPGINGLEATRRIHAISPDSRVLFLSEQGSHEFVVAAFEAGAFAYILKSDAASDLMPGIRAILESREYVSRSLRRRRSSDIS